MGLKKHKADASADGDGSSPDLNSEDERPRLLQNDLIEKGENKVVGGRKKKVIDEVNEAYFQKVMELIAGNGNLNNLSIPYYKAYLRTHGLRLSGAKGELLDRVELHVRLKRGEIEEYDKSTFKIECTDVLCGDVIMFQQKGHTRGVTISSWEASRDRLVVGRVIKETYRGTKQQHMFTIEVFWSNGYQALDPLSILHIKGCNLYQSKIYRQERKSESCRPEPLEETSGSCIANRESRGGEEEIMEIEGVEIKAAYEQPEETVDARKSYKGESESYRPEMLEETRGSCLANRESREGEEETMKIEDVEIEVNENECPQELVAYERPQETQETVAKKESKKWIEQALAVSSKSKLKKMRKKKRKNWCSKNKCPMLASKSCAYAMCGLCCSRQSCKRHKNQPKARSIRFKIKKHIMVTRATSRAIAEQGILEQVS